jgi:hypothetical protein
MLADARTGKSGRYRLAGYKNVNGPKRLCRDPAMCWVRLLIWPFFLLVFFCATLAPAPAIAETRAGSSVAGHSSSMPARPAPRPADLNDPVFARGVQERLNALGFAVGAVDGHFGRRSRAALRSFKRSQGLADDASIDEGTLRTLSLPFTADPAVPTPPSLRCGTAA